ncbi:MAG: hypothetical protein EBU90_10785 [Proteobacteria bacterium]|nr:hypothetical protein [Pseudomonadota bacterium]NBP14657.1 hypothetical protein [bacterium]
MTISDLFIIFGIFILFTCTLNYYRDAFDGSIVGNAFSDLMCITDDVNRDEIKGEFPVFRIKPQGSFECLSKDSKGCLMRSDFDIPDSARCTTFFGKDGIRNLTGRNKTIFNEFETGTGNVSYLTCSSDSMNKKDHWCGQLADTFTDQCNKSVGFKTKHNLTCDSINNFKKQSGTNAEYIVTNSQQIVQNAKNALAATQSVRNRATNTIVSAPPTQPPPQTNRARRVA